MDTTRKEFIVKMRRLLDNLEKGEYSSERFQDCDISLSIYGGSVSFYMGPVKAELKLYRMTLDELKLAEKSMKEAKGNE